MAKKEQYTLHVEGIPEHLMRAMKITAAVEGKSIKSLIIDMMEQRTGVKSSSGGDKMLITVTQNKFHGDDKFYQGKSEAQAIKAARKHDCVDCHCGGPIITREDGKRLYNWRATKPFSERSKSFWD